MKTNDQKWKMNYCRIFSHSQKGSENKRKIYGNLPSQRKLLIGEMCRLFKVSRSGYYGYVSRINKPAKDLPLAEKIKECQDKCSKIYGYRRVHIWLQRNGIHLNNKTILRVM